MAKLELELWSGTPRMLFCTKPTALQRARQGLSKCFHSCGLSSPLLPHHIVKKYKEVLGPFRGQAQVAWETLGVAEEHPEKEGGRRKEVGRGLPPLCALGEVAFATWQGGPSS